MAVWRTKEWQAFAAAYQVRMLHFDQGPMGHVKRKPTTLAVVMRDLPVLDGVRGPPSRDQDEHHGRDRQAMTLQERCDDSKGWAAWAPGLKTALVLAVQGHMRAGSTPSLEHALRPLGPLALESWRQHYLNDHTPARRDCRDCVRTSARSKPHLHFERGPLWQTGDWPGPSRHDCKYMLVAVYTFPADRSGKALVEFAGESSQDVC